MAYNGLPAQLAKENKKFIYNVLKPGARAKEFELAVQWLCDTGLTHKVQRISKGGIPLKAYEDISSFKLYCSDVGLLAAMSDLDPRSIINGNKIFTEFKGALTEQFVCQQLLSDCSITPYYWSADTSTGEVDFVFQFYGKVIPLEVKAEENLKAKSLKIYIEKNDIERGIRTSMSDYRKEEKLTNLPLYAISNIRKIV